MHCFLLALQHLTRLPTPQIPFDEGQLGRSSMFFPLVGILLGGMLVLINWAAGHLFPGAVQAAIVVVALVVLTGGIHLDGLMDTADGLFSGKPRGKKLEIMKDSRVGAFGSLAVFCLLLFKYSLVTGLTGLSAFPALIMMTVFGRWAVTYALAAFPYARAQGMGTLYSQYTGRFELVVAALTALVAAVGLGGAGGVLLFLVTSLSAHMLCRWMVHLLGGLTGDTYGALNEVLEVLVLMVYLPLIRYFPLLFPH